jgi:hypothetical protein
MFLFRVFTERVCIAAIGRCILMENFHLRFLLYEKTTRSIGAQIEITLKVFRLHQQQATTRAQLEPREGFEP